MNAAVPTTTETQSRSRSRGLLIGAAAGLALSAVVGTAAIAMADNRLPAGPAPGPSPLPTIAPTSVPPIGDRFARTELFFGTEKSGPDVNDAQFRGFVNREVTPRFPDGLTQYDALGQFRDSSGKIIKERAKVIILLYPAEVAGPSSVRIEEIRDAYEEAFDQESVLRSDSVELVSF
jgi:hypothetical protein